MNKKQSEQTTIEPVTGNYAITKFKCKKCGNLSYMSRYENKASSEETYNNECRCGWVYQVEVLK